MFAGGWTKAEATIVARNTKFTGDGTTAIHEYVADVRRSDDPPFRTTVREPTIATDFWPPNVGDVVSVLVKDKNNKVKFDKDDDRLSVKAFEARQKQQFEAIQHGQAAPPPSFVGFTPTAASTPDPATRLQALAKLRDVGLLSEAEYTEQRQRILDAI